MKKKKKRGQQLFWGSLTFLLFWLGFRWCFVVTCMPLKVIFQVSHNAAFTCCRCKQASCLGISLRPISLNKSMMWIWKACWVVHPASVKRIPSHSDAVPCPFILLAYHVMCKHEIGKPKQIYLLVNECVITDNDILKS